MTDTPADVKWVIAVAGYDEPLVVEAATVENHASGSTIRGQGDVALTSLLDADGQLVFQAPALGIAYLLRASDPG